MTDNKSITPPYFSGTSAEDAAQWLRHFENYSVFKTLDDGKQLALFKVLLRGNAAIWLDSQSNATLANMPAVKAAFKARYKTPDTVMYQNASQLFSKRQDADLSSEDYIAIMRKLGSEIGADERMIRFAILNGLRPELRAFVIQNQPENFDQLIEAARLAELSSLPSCNSDTSAALLDQIANMQSQLKEVSAKWDRLLSAPVDLRPTTSPPPDSATNRTQPFPPSTGGSRSTFGPTRGQPPERPKYESPNSNLRDQFSSTYTGRCSRCARRAHADIDLCPAVNQTCYYCRSKGHFSVCCRTALRARSHAHQQSQQQFPRPVPPFNPY